MSKEKDKTIANRDDSVIEGFGQEWARFSQESLSEAERSKIFADYFDIFPWQDLPRNACGADIGCGSGRWAALVAPKVDRLTCVDASGPALDIARRNLAGHGNVIFHLADVGNLPFAENELDFAYSLGVLHHVPNTRAALANVARVLKPGGIFLLYLYYAFDNRPLWFRALWRFSDSLRGIVCRLPARLRFFVCDIIAAFVYFPLARTALLVDKMGISTHNFPLSYYQSKSFYVMRTDALDRFGTRLEKRFSKEEISGMLNAAGFEGVRFSPNAPYWCALGRKR